MEAPFKTPLFASIVTTAATYGVIEGAAFEVAGAAVGFGIPFLSIYLLTQIIFHLAIIVFLVLASDLFVVVGSEERLTRVNIANKVTLLRISMLPSILFLIIAGKNFAVGPILLPVLVLTFMTDLIDGKLSRSRNQVTYMGKVLDSVSDYALLIVVAIAYVVYRLLPPWLFIVIVFRLFFQGFGMLGLLIKNRKVEPKASLFGKVAIATTMVLFAIEAFRLFSPFGLRGILPYLEYAAGGVVGLSVLDKGWFFFRQFASRSEEGLSRP